MAKRDFSLNTDGQVSQLDGLQLGQRLRNVTRISTTNVDIHLIAPSPIQPRRVVPYELDAAYDVAIREGAWEAFFGQWASASATDLKVDTLNVMGYLTGEESAKQEKDVGGMADTFLALLGLAATIRREGLQNPISIAPHPDVPGAFMIEAGERRWLSFQLLNAMFPYHGEGRDYSSIPAVQQTAISATRQAMENKARRNLNPIEDTRQLAILLMEFNREAGLVDGFAPPQAFAHEREYFAQAMDLTTPQGRGTELQQLLGVNSQSAVSRLKSLLKMPNDLWDAALREGWSLNQCLKAMKDADSPKPKKQKLTGIPKAVRAQYMLLTATLSADERDMLVKLLTKEIKLDD